MEFCSCGGLIIHGLLNNKCGICQKEYPITKTIIDVATFDNSFDKLAIGHLEVAELNPIIHKERILCDECKLETIHFIARDGDGTKYTKCSICKIIKK